jgi:hypothetical protein
VLSENSIHRPFSGRQLSARDLQSLHEVGGAHEHDAPAVLDEARPSAAFKWLLPPPGGPNSSTLAPFFNQASPAASAMICAFETIGTLSKSKVASVLPIGNRASAR